MATLCRVPDIVTPPPQKHVDRHLGCVGIQVLKATGETLNGAHRTCANLHFLLRTTGDDRAAVHLLGKVRIVDENTVRPEYMWDGIVSKCRQFVDVFECA